MPVGFGAGLDSTNALNEYMEINTKMDYHIKTTKAVLIANKETGKYLSKQSHSPRSLQREQEHIAAVHEVPAFWLQT